MHLLNCILYNLEDIAQILVIQIIRFTVFEIPDHAFTMKPQEVEIIKSYLNKLCVCIK